MKRTLPTLLLGLALMACTIEEPPGFGELAPGFQLTDLDGNAVSLEGLAGQIVLVDFWATWCPPCVEEIPELNAFYSDFRSQGVTVLAISVDEETPDFLKRWAEEKGIRYPVVIGDMDVARAYGADQFPYHVLISAEGQVLERLTPGFHDRQELTALVQRYR